MTASWTQDELTKIGGSEELHVASARRDGTLARYVTVWVVRVGDGLYVRSAYGPKNPWYVRARNNGTGRIRAGGIEQDVSFTAASPGVEDAVDAAYKAKYDRYGPAIVDTVVGETAHQVTLCLAPRRS
ncbi:DUF2255 family protein [Cellulomonas sp. P22]|uniref:DUF2255 family protein n=1 Tax=Cellulomonas sp. P22 TaxID=3373189 RepID=UPI00378C43C7